MEANEFRIGNYVFSKMVEDTIQLSALLESQDLQVEPIPLTEEWLFKFGFKKIKIKTTIKGFYIISYKLNDFVVYLLSDFFEVELIRQNKEQFNLFKTFKKEVHFLQNLYFALINEELKLNK